MAAGGEEAVSVGDETDQEKPGDEHEGRPVLGRRRPGLVRGQQRRRQEEPATAGGRAPVPGDGRRSPGHPASRCAAPWVCARWADDGNGTRIVDTGP